MNRVSDYSSDETFNLECERLFDEYFHFGVHICELQNESEFYRIDAAGRNIVLWNDSGTIKAFENCCPHRGCRIIDKEEGCGKMVCPYHGWTFNDGKVAIPSKKDFNPKDIDNISLKYYSVEQCGNFIFFSPSPKQSLKDQLGDFYNDVEKMSYSINARVDKNPQLFESNWKIGVENAIENYHLPMIHSKTLQPLKHCIKSIKYEKCNSLIFVSIENEKVNRKLLRAKDLFKNRYEYDGYFSLYIFPFSMISSTYGYSYGIQTFLPKTPIKTNFMSRTYSIDSNLESFFDRVSLLNQQIFLEDATICEMVQKASSRATKDVKFIYAQSMEERIKFFHLNYNEVII